MPIRYQIAFRGTARPSVCSAWRHKVPKKSVWRIRNPISYRNSVLCRNLLLVSALFAHSETLAFRGTWSGCASALNLGSLSSSAKLASLFRHFLPFRLLAQLRRFCVCEKLIINIYLHIPQRSGGRSRQQGQGGRGVFIKTG